MKKDILKKAIGTIKSKSARTVLKAQKNSPEIMMGVGVVSIVAGTVFACKATLKLEDLLEESNENIDMVKEAKGMEGYSDKDYKRDLTVVYVQSAAKVAKNYAPAIALTGLGLSLVVGSHRVMKKRNVALMASYSALDKAYEEYRERVKEKYGEEAEKMVKYGLKKEKMEIDGKKEEVYVAEDDPSRISQYAKYFDDFSRYYSNSSEQNRLFLQNQQRFANELLRSRGHIFLNEVYDMLGIPRTGAGALVGWVYDEELGADNYVDFGIFNTSDSDARVFVNGHESAILLDFNVDGVIHELI